MLYTVLHNGKISFVVGEIDIAGPGFALGAFHDPGGIAVGSAYVYRYFIITAGHSYGLPVD